LYIDYGVTAFPWNHGTEFAAYFVFVFVDVCGCVQDRSGQIPMVCQLV
jgi:hypothetical protein